MHVNVGRPKIVTLKIRDAQMTALGASARDGVLLSLTAHLHEIEAPPETTGEDVLRMAEGYGLFVWADLRRIATVAAAHGTAWASEPATQWMDAMMTDRRVSNPRDRLSRLESELDDRARIARSNADALQRFRDGP
jgi:hypothetical protein